jgi:uncharacterized protein YndB with AHSA1/START domain
MDINRDAPVQEGAQAEIAAPLELVWEVQSELARWPEWNPDITDVQLTGPLAPGSVFKWKAGGLRIVSELQEVNPPQRLAWTGRTLGIRAVHTWTFEETGGRTRVSTEESFEGWLPGLLRRPLGQSLRTTLEKGLSALAAECERRVTEGAGAKNP